MASGSRSSRPCRLMMERRRRPPMLKDFLVGDADAINSRSSSSVAGFKSLDQPAALQRSRSRSRAAAEATISALQKLLNAVKLLPSLPSAVKSRKGNAEESVARVRVKDILRWKSFTTLDVIDGQDYAAAAVGGNIIVGGEDPVWTGAGAGHVPYTVAGPTKKEDDEEDQQSPVSVLDSPFTSHDQDSSSFDQSLANVEKKRERLMESIKWFETQASLNRCTNFHNHLEDQIKETPIDDHIQVEHDHIKAYSTSKCKIRVKNCVEKYCIEEMEKEATWSKFNEQCTQIGLELEMGMLNFLLDELLFELVISSNIVSYHHLSR